MILRLALVLFAGFVLVPSVHGQPPAKPRTDSLGDLLPPGAIAQLGTLRFKHDPGQSARITTAIFSPDGKKIASLADNGSLRLWDAATGKELPGPWSTASGCAAFAFSPDSAILAADFVRSLGSTVSMPLTLWNIAEAKTVKTLNDERALGGLADPKKEIPYKNLSTRSLAFTDNGRILFAAQADGTVRSWDVATGKVTRVFEPLDGKLKPPQIADNPVPVPTLNFSFSPGAKYLAALVTWRTTFIAEKKGAIKTSTRIDTEVFTLDLSGVKEPWRIEGNGQDMVARFAFSADNKRVAIIVAPNQVELRDTATGKLIASPPLDQMFPDTGKINGLALSSDGSTMAVAGRDLLIALWNLKDPSKLRKIVAEAPYRADAQCVAFSPDNKTLLLGAGSDLQLYDVATLKEINPWEGHRGAVEYLEFSADGKRLFTGSAQTDLHYEEVATWDVASWQRLQWSSTRSPKWPNIGVPSPEHTYYTGRTGDDRFSLYNFADGKLVARFSVPAGQDPNARGYFLPGSMFYVLAGEDKGKGVQRIYAVPSGKLLCTLPAVYDSYMVSARSLAFSADGRLVAGAARDDGKIQVIETKSGKVLQLFGKGFSDGQGRFRYPLLPRRAFSSDGQWLASWMEPKQTIQVWDIATGKERFQLPVNAQTTNSGREIAWSPDGRLLAVGSSRIQIWELATQKVRREIVPPSGGFVRDLAFSPNGRLLASASSDRKVLIWDMANGDRLGMPGAALKPRDLESRWQTLAADDAAKAFAAICDLTAAPKETVAWIKDKLKPATLDEAKHIDELITQLENDQYKVRQKATAELLKIGERVVPTIEKVLAANPPLETRLRLQELRTKLTGLVLQGERLQAYRAVEVLERIGTLEARQLLQTLADGAAGALLTNQAQAALERLKSKV